MYAALIVLLAAAEPTDGGPAWSADTGPVIPVDAEAPPRLDLLDAPGPLVPPALVGERVFTEVGEVAWRPTLAWDQRWWGAAPRPPRGLEHPDVVAHPSVLLRAGFAEAGALSMQQDLLWSARSTTNGHLDAVSRQSTSSMLVLRLRAP